MALILEKIIIIGGNAAGMSAAARARRNDPKAQIIVYEKSGYVSYASCGLPYFIGNDLERPEDLLAVSLDELTQERNIDVRLRHEAVSFDPRKKLIKILDIEKQKTITQLYDRMIIASGASPIIPAVPGASLKNAFALRSLEDGIKIKSTIKSEKFRNAIIVGAGYIGLEMAEALKKQGMNVTVIEQRDQVLPYIDADMAALLEKELLSKSCQIIKSAGVKEALGEERVSGVRLMCDREIPADLLLWAVGVKPNVHFAESGGIQLGRTGAIQVSPRMQTNVFGVYACGDCAEVKNMVTNKSDYIPLATTANKQGRVAGDNAAGKFSQFQGVVGTSVVKVFDLEIARTGVTSDYAESVRIPFRSVVIKDSTRARYYPLKKEISVKLIFRMPDGRLLGGQIIGGDGAAKRIDVLATALQQKMTVADLAVLDVSYAPPFAPVWDPLLIAANQAVKLMRKKNHQ